MTLVWTRIDQKLIHGQIALAWAPHLKINAIVVADRGMLDDPKGQVFMKMGLPPEIQAAFFVAPEGLSAALEREELKRRRVLLLFRDVEGLVEAAQSGLKLKKINLGYQAGPSAEEAAAIRLGQTFYLREGELAALSRLHAEGLEIILQGIPADKAVRWAPAKGTGGA